MDDVHLVEAQLDARGPGPEHALVAQLADGDPLDERRVARVLEDQRPRVRGGPVDGRRDPIGRALQLEAPRRAAGRLGVLERLDRDDRGGAALAEPDGEPGTRQGAVGGVDVAILDLDGLGPGADAGQVAELVRGEDTLGRGAIVDPVLELDFDAGCRRAGRGAVESSPGGLAGRRLSSVTRAGPASRPRRPGDAPRCSRARSRGRAP